MKAIFIVFVIVLVVGMVIGYWFRDVVEKKQVQVLPDAENIIRITAYSPDPSQTDSTPFIMASGKRVTVNDLYNLRYAAVSRDIKKRLELNYGDRLVILVEMELEVQDITNKKLENTIDLFTRSRSQAQGWGVKIGRIKEIKRKIF